jgi:tetratricopeptide (TPR) repeat protein
MAISVPRVFSRPWQTTFAWCVSLFFALAPALNAQSTAGVPSCASTHKEVERLWCDGSRAFIEETPAGYQKAVTAYSRALALEKTKRVLGRNAWLILIDNLGIAYGITGDLRKSRETLEYGLTVEPKYPMFFYNLACGAAEGGDRARTLELLKKAFALRANVIPSEQMPEPSTDDSFQRFMNDPQFVAAVKALPRA